MEKTRNAHKHMEVLQCWKQLDSISWSQVSRRNSCNSLWKALHDCVFVPVLAPSCRFLWESTARASKALQTNSCFQQGRFSLAIETTRNDRLAFSCQISEANIIQHWVEDIQGDGWNRSTSARLDSSTFAIYTKRTSQSNYYENYMCFSELPSITVLTRHL